MSLFVDASALVAMIANEPEADRFVAIVSTERELLWSAMSCWETVSALQASHRWSIEDARAEVELVISKLPFRLVPIDEAERTIALNAYRQYGRGSGHPARLNMGDCFAYACATTTGATLLYKGDDFAHTDLA